MDLKKEVKHMLRLTLRTGDFITIGDDVRVYFSHKLTQGRISVGIEAPREKAIDRNQSKKQYHNPQERDFAVSQAANG